jgi:hypothetical protein
MPDRAEKSRLAAAECLALARTTTDASTRAALITMAQQLYDLASRPAIDFEAIVQIFNEGQMSKR